MPFSQPALIVNNAIKHSAVYAWRILCRVSVRIVRTIRDIVVASFDGSDNENIHYKDSNYHPHPGESLVRGYDNQVWEEPGKFD